MAVSGYFLSKNSGQMDFKEESAWKNNVETAV